MYYLVILIRQTNFDYDYDYDTVIGVYDCLAKAEKRIAAFKKKHGYSWSYRIDCGEMNTERYL